MLKIVDISAKPRLKKVVHRMPVQTPAPSTGSGQAPAPDVQPIPFEHWPFAFKVLAKLATPEDQGIGDVIERIVGPIGGGAFKSWYKLATGHDCGCGARKQILNARYPSNSFRPS
jgi:hypothetical protein